MAKAAKRKVAEVMDEGEIDTRPKKSAKKQKSMEETFTKKDLQHLKRVAMR